MIFGRKKKTVRRVRKKAVRKVKRKKVTRKRKGKAFGGYQIKPDVNLAKVIGSRPVTPSQMTKKVWQYIKKNNLGKR